MSRGKRTSEKVCRSSCIPAAIPAGTRKSTISSQHHDYCIYIVLYGYGPQAMIKNGTDMLTQTDKVYPYITGPFILLRKKLYSNSINLFLYSLPAYDFRLGFYGMHL